MLKFLTAEKKNFHATCKIYYGLCEWGESQVKTTACNTDTRWYERKQCAL